MSSTLNRSGLSAEESKKLAIRTPTSEETQVISGIKQLYSCSVKSETCSIYPEAAVFHDPIGKAEGLNLIKSQFNALPKIFAKSTIDKFNVLENPAGLAKNTILIDQDITYYRKVDSPTKTVNSLLTLERDSNGKITTHTEEYREPDATDGFFGQINEWRKVATAQLTGAAVDKDASKI